MTIQANTADQYIDKLPKERRDAINKLRSVIKENLPSGFSEGIYYGMIGYVVPHSIYPDGYHCDPKQPLPFISIASQKNHVAVYHSGLYADLELMDWFVSEYKKQSTRKLDMGKSCLRFRNIDDIPFNLIGKLSQKVSPKNWIEIYEANIKPRSKP
jgi:uncharacterized protein YdhG (YjbR/CyaY superfamily)